MQDVASLNLSGWITVRMQEAKNSKHEFVLLTVPWSLMPKAITMHDFCRWCGRLSLLLGRGGLSCWSSVCMSWFCWTGPRKLFGVSCCQQVAQIRSMADLQDLWPGLRRCSPPCFGPGPFCQGSLERCLVSTSTWMGHSEFGLCLAWSGSSWGSST